MPIFCKLKDGREMVVFSDNIEQQTMHVYPAEDYDRASFPEGCSAEWLSLIEVRYDEIERTDTNRTAAFAVKRRPRQAATN